MSAQRSLDQTNLTVICFGSKAVKRVLCVLWVSKCIFLHSIQFILLTPTKHCIHIGQTIRNFSEKIQFDSTEKNRCAAIFVHTIVCVCVDSILDVRSNGPKGNKLHMLLYFWCRWCWLLTAVVSSVCLIHYFLSHTNSYFIQMHANCEDCLCDIGTVYAHCSSRLAICLIARPSSHTFQIILFSF